MTENATVLAAMRDRAAERLPPQVRALLNSQDEEVVIFALHGDTVYLNAAAEASLPPGSLTPFAESRRFRAELAARGGRVVPLRLAAKAVGEMIVVPRRARTWAEQEREAIRQTLHQTGGRRAEAARWLGVSRTTLWRRLRAERR